MKKVTRRTFFGSSLAAALTMPAALSGAPKSRRPEQILKADTGPDIIDTNVNLLDWPFRKLKYGHTKQLVEKLRHHRIKQAWAGSFEALFHKDIEGVNTRLAEECRTNGAGMLIPFGAVNLAWPDWEEDLRRCHEKFKMPGVRLFPGYQTFDLTHPDFPRFVELASHRGLIIQIVGDMEDTRTHHPVLEVRGMNIDPLVDVVKKIPKAKVQLLYWNHRVEGKKLDKLISETGVTLDISRIESTGGVGRMIEGKPWDGFGTAKAVPVERLLFGSHAPYFPVETNLLKLFESPLSLKQMGAIMADNARRLLEKS